MLDPNYVVGERIEISSFLKEVMLGLILGDLNVSKGKRSSNARLRFEYGSKSSDYANHLFSLFSKFCSTGPILRARFDKRTNKVYEAVYFSSIANPSFTHYYNIFYGPNGLKYIPHELEIDFTDVSLAYWAMDDGSKSRNNFCLNTDCFQFEDLKMLSNSIFKKFGIKTAIHVKRKDQYRIYILSESISLFKKIVSPHFHSSMLYKLQ